MRLAASVGVVQSLGEFLTRVDHGEVQAYRLTGERREKCERPHLRGRNGTGRPAKRAVQSESFVSFAMVSSLVRSIL